MQVIANEVHKPAFKPKKFRKVMTYKIYENPTWEPESNVKDFKIME